MKGFYPILAAAMALVPLCSANAETKGYETTFAIPTPYAEGDPVVGLDGWQSGSEGANQEGAVVRLPWDPEKTALILKKTSPLDPVFNLKNSLETPLEGEVRADIGFGFHFPEKKSTDGVFIFAFSNPSAASPRIGVGMNFAAEGGLFYYSDKSRVVILPKDEVKTASIYQVSLKVNLFAHRFDLTVTGVKADDSEFSYSISDVPFPPISGNRISNFYLWSSLPNQWTTYVSSIRVESLME